MSVTISGQTMSEQKIGRLDFLKVSGSMLAGAAFEGMSQNESYAKKELPDRTSFLNREIFRSKNEKIDYSAERKELTENLKAVLLEVMAFQEEFKVSFGIAKAGAEADIGPQMLDTKAMLSYGEIEQKKSAFWKKLRGLISDLPSYSFQSYDTFMVYDFPRLLAPYRILAKPVFVPRFASETNYVKDAYAFLAFYDISNVESDSTVQWGKTLQRDVVYVKQPLAIDGTIANNNFASRAPGQAFYNNILIYAEHLTEALKKKEEIVPLVERFKAVGEEELWQFVESAPTPEEQNERAVMSTYMKILVKIQEKALDRLEEIDHLIEHETTHVVNQIDADFRKLFLPPTTTNGREYLMYMGNLTAHEEINAHLGELRYSPYKELALRNLIGPLSTVWKEDIGHEVASKWGTDKLITLIKKDHEKYRININKTRQISSENQILMQLSQLLQQPKSIEELADQLMEIHRKNYTEDLSEEYLKLFPTLPKKKEIPWEQICWVGIPAAVGTTAALIGKEIIHRRNITQTEQAIRTIFEKQVTGKGRRERAKREALQRRAEIIITDLQLWEKSRILDQVKRREALRSLIDESHRMPELQMVILRLENIVDKETKNYLAQFRTINRQD